MNHKKQVQVITKKPRNKGLIGGLTEYINEWMKDDNFNSIKDIYNCIVDEVGYIEKSEDKKAMVKHWLLGLGGSYDFTYFDIEKRLRSYGVKGSQYKLNELYRDTMAYIIIKKGCFNS